MRRVWPLRQAGRRLPLRRRANAHGVVARLAVHSIVTGRGHEVVVSADKLRRSGTYERGRLMMTEANHVSLSRRSLLAGLSGAAAAGFLGSARDAHAKAPLQSTQAPGFYRFKVGAIEATAITDGP